MKGALRCHAAGVAPLDGRFRASSPECAVHRGLETALAGGSGLVDGRYAGARVRRGEVGHRAAGTGLTEAGIDEAFNAGRVLRTHVLRPTWHFVMPADIRWMLAVSGPRVHAANRHYYKKTGVDSPLLIRSRRLIERSLAGGNALTRTELAAVLARAGAHAQGNNWRT